MHKIIYGCLDSGSIVVMGIGRISKINTDLGPVLPTTVDVGHSIVLGYESGSVDEHYPVCACCYICLRAAIARLFVMCNEYCPVAASKAL